MNNEIKLGDILVFEAENDWISKSIALLTHSKVSHAAMVYKDMTVVEMGLSGIQSNPFHIDDIAGRKVYVLRFDADKNLSPVIKRGEEYLKNNVQYDKPSLYLLAGLLIYRQIRPNKKLQKITNFIIRTATLMVDKIINRCIHDKSTKVMVCSQLVYQCYQDCGEEYKIKIHDGILQNSPKKGEIRLADMIKKYDVINTPHDDIEEESLVDDNNLTRELYLALSSNEEHIKEVELASTVSYAKQFIEKIEHLLDILSIDLPVQALFITPEDLLHHTTNLKQITSVKIARD